MINIQPFYLHRKQDVNGVSGTGIVAVGAVFPGGEAVVQWLTFTSTITHFKSIDHVKEIHGHDGATEIIMGDPPKEKKTKKKVRKSETK